MPYRTIATICLRAVRVQTITSRLAICLLLFYLLGSSLGYAFTADSVDKDLLKALYTYKFGKFTTWPHAKLNSTTPQFHYCILGQPPFSQQTLTSLIDTKVQGVPLSIAVFDSGLIPEEVLATCHTLFISRSEKHRLATVFSTINRMPILTVSDIAGFSQQGGMITLIEIQGKLRFEINPHAMALAGISISSKIMKLAKLINTGAN